MLDLKSNVNVSLDKLIQPAQLYNAVNQDGDVLFVTHDYYESVTSKTKLMKLVAEYGKNVSICYSLRDRIYSLPLPFSMTIMDMLILNRTIYLLNKMLKSLIPILLLSEVTYKIGLNSFRISITQRTFGKTNFLNSQQRKVLPQE